ncbi:hypothetical protein XAP412_890059 [Xanthomonas phaseoli pv. phaseoli]|uniref:Uncharacterized protein n=1 Tax=Xanthomonas campestris pv. phaseoli TaxID=317013 RepID=A0AB38E688_XANCH|nr:hypothetical protein XAP6984_920059 [Xanthomonas phaseoli pv. phaseoli]SON91343.1 hypothetical protein XAP412_890059 [Xanthomonas phaseoli pv. phaseoli]SON92929.1 hypothetical protein XAP7430_910061 [Xanthomonas phaseoli pv. phaseoli]SOO29896.1 hypothetical protein XAP6164_3770003 [Xanthomonas phaseoli pv. phaseoli]
MPPRFARVERGKCNGDRVPDAVDVGRGDVDLAGGHARRTMVLSQEAHCCLFKTVVQSRLIRCCLAAELESAHAWRAQQCVR